MVAFGLSAPFANLLLADAGLAQTAPEAAYTPTKAGGGGSLKALWWQAPTLLNPHFAVGTKDQDASRIFYEPLAAWDADGNPGADPGRRDPQARRTATSPPTASRSSGS